MVTVRDVAVTLQRQEMVRRISEEISQYVSSSAWTAAAVAPGRGAHDGARPGQRMVLRDYMDPGSNGAGPRTGWQPPGLSSTDLIDLGTIASVLGFNPSTDSLEAVIQPKGYRLLSGIKAVPPRGDRLVDHFDGLRT
jgi:diadenylate cyclase